MSDTKRPRELWVQWQDSCDDPLPIVYPAVCAKKFVCTFGPQPILFREVLEGEADTSLGDSATPKVLEQEIVPDSEINDFVDQFVAQHENAPDWKSLAEELADAVAHFSTRTEDMVDYGWYVRLLEKFNKAVGK